ncbi:MAG: hypothetical protein OEV59_07435 [Deltaproteobacteria bacterium]|nr:hypothetical protein [Deltaproteobacteria bacterium]
MKNGVFLALIAAVMFLLAGCVDTDTSVSVKKDGSGEITSRIIFVAASKSADAKPTVVDEAMTKKYEALAAEMGEGVTLKAVEPVKADNGHGIRVQYAFTDISKVKISTENMMGESSKDNAAATFYTFAFKNNAAGKTVKAGNANPESVLLTVIAPKRDKKKAEPKDKASGAKKRKTPEEEARDEEMFKKMFDGFRMALTVKVDGKIKKTNAARVDKDGGAVTMMDINYGKLINDEKKLKRFLGEGKKADKMDELSGRYDELFADRAKAVDIVF